MPILDLHRTYRSWNRILSPINLKKDRRIFSRFSFRIISDEFENFLA